MAKSEAFLEGESLKPLINTLAILFVILSTIAVALRIYTRRALLHVFGADDVSITIAQVLAVAVSVTTGLEAVWGLGRHTRFVSQGDAIKQSKSLYANIMIYNAAQIITKISFLIQYRRLFPSRKMQKICFWLLIFIVIWGLAQEFIVSFSCTPLTLFEPKMSGKCIWALPVWYLTSSMNIVTDFIIFVIPIIPVLKLQMRTRQKVLLLGLFCLGFLQVSSHFSKHDLTSPSTCIISLIRLSTLHKGINTTDPFWDNAPAAYWSVVELNCGILCACLPTLRPLISKFVPKLLTTRGSTAKSSTGTSNRLSALHSKKSQPEDGIYVRKEIELHSTTELRSNAAGFKNSLEEGSQDSQSHTTIGANGYVMDTSKG
ncbi:hypothetical protein BDV96DRAFT_645067 [Lophiotrema nucula]|uniref:Rhodopsin domain-containing protein n=1 Tax=Lophiotrema nucula TaxID=690887 RepID=A0A6A5ZB07_9PLEO|nr:hypothetical protein BDV96DRAFT_645067 [Lophiotrema nucula]